MKRKYTKKNSEYWSSLGKRPDKGGGIELSMDAEPSLIGDPIYVAKASYSRNNGPTGSSTRRKNSGPRTPISDAYSNINELSVPFSYGKNGNADIKEAIVLCQKAYFHVSILRNTLDVLAELSDADIVLYGGTKASKNFIKKWMNSAQINDVKDQFFREYYRSGNVFLYRVFAEYSPTEIESMKKIYASNENLVEQDSGFPKNNIPIRYVLLNPLDIENCGGIFGQNVFKKVLSGFEAERINNPTTDEERRLLKKIQEENPKKIGRIANDKIYMDLDRKRLIFAFYKKQDYEPFAVPFAFPVLRDINWKLELKKIDQSVSRSLENSILLITMGAKKEEGGINPKNMAAMKRLFENESVGRVLVADYTTKAQFIIPEIEKILGSEKYKTVNQDIKEGLQNIFFEDAKYSNIEIKMKVFLEKLKEGRRIFLEKFLQPEIKKVCKEIGFTKSPTVRFRSTTMLNEGEIKKAAIRLMELGILPPKQGVDSLNNGELPDPSEIGEGQLEYKKQREEGQYVPLVGGTPLYSEEESAPKEGAPVKIPPKAVGRPKKDSIAKEELISVKNVAEIMKEISSLEGFAVGCAKKEYNKKKLSGPQSEAVMSLCKAVVLSNEKGNWKKTIEACISNPSSSIDKLIIKPEILEICEKYKTDEFEGAIIYHSKKI